MKNHSNRPPPRKLGDYLEVTSKSVFKTGISWRVIKAKWPTIREAFRELDADAFASIAGPDLDALTSARQ